MNDVAVQEGMFDFSDSCSLISLLPETIADCLLEARETIETNDERSLREKIKRITNFDEDIRLGFWREYEQAQLSGAPMKAHRIYDGICSQPWFYKNIRNPLKMAFIATPPRRFENAADAGLLTGMAKINDILNTEVYKKDKNGNLTLDLAAANLVTKTFKMLWELRHGSTVRRNLNINVAKPQTNSKTETEEELMKELQEVEAQLDGQTSPKTET